MKASHIVQETLRGIRRNRSSYLLATAVQAVCLLLLSVFVVISVNVTALSRTAGRKVEVYVFLKEQGYSALLESRIAAIEGIAAVRYVSKDEALEELKTDLEEDASLVEALGENPLPASIRVSVADGYGTEAQLAEIERKVGLMAGVDEVWSGRDVVGRLNRIQRTVLFLNVAILVLVSCAVVFIVFQTVESSIVSRRHEIEVMDLVGASRAAVRLPFIIEGTSQGLAGGMVAFLLVFLLCRVVAALIPTPGFPLALLLLADLGLGALLGLAGAVIALGRVRQ